MSIENKKTENPNVFPSEKTEYTDIGGMDISSKVYMKGMSLRDYFAAKAMHAFLVGDGTTAFETRSREAYEMADEMLKQRQNETDK